MNSLTIGLLSASHCPEKMDFILLSAGPSEADERLPWPEVGRGGLPYGLV
jgi:hypothetical protein